MSARMNRFDVLTREEEEVNALLNAPEGRRRGDGVPLKKSNRRDRGLVHKQRQQSGDVPLTVRYVFLREGLRVDERVSDKAKFKQQLREMKCARKDNSSGKQQQPEDDDPVTIRHVIFVEGGQLEEIVSNAAEVHGRLLQMTAEFDPLNRKVMDLNFPPLERTGNKKPVNTKVNTKVMDLNFPTLDRTGKNEQTKDRAVPVKREVEVWKPKIPR